MSVLFHKRNKEIHTAHCLASPDHWVEPKDMSNSVAQICNYHYMQAMYGQETAEKFLKNSTTS